MTDKSKGTRGISAFIVELLPGFSVGKPRRKLSCTAPRRLSSVFTDCIVPEGEPPRRRRQGLQDRYADPWTAAPYRHRCTGTGHRKERLEESINFAKTVSSSAVRSQSSRTLGVSLLIYILQSGAARLLTCRLLLLSLEGSPLPSGRCNR